jgi:serine/threonine-protein kinase RsbW
VFDFTDEFAGQNKLAASVVFSMNLAVEELFTNIVKYGARNDKDIGIDLSVCEGHLVIEVTDDDAEPFDITASREVDVTRSLGDRKEGGLGIHIIRSIMDYVKYEYSDRCTRVVLKKRLDPEGSNV